MNRNVTRRRIGAGNKVDNVTSDSVIAYCNRRRVTCPTNMVTFSLNGYASMFLPRSESSKSRRGHGGVCLVYKDILRNDISIIETDNTGLI